MTGHLHAGAGNHRIRSFAVLFAVAIAYGGCSMPVPVFDSERAFADLVHQTEFGPRVPGSVAHDNCAQWLSDELALSADSVWRQPFLGSVPGVADSVHMVNLVARFRSNAARRVLVAAHWDTRPFADRDPVPARRDQPIDGANDGASGVAVLLELARGFAETPPPVGVDIALFDGEDLGSSGKTPGAWIQGSRYYAAHLPAEYEWVIVVDMVGDRDLAFPKEGYSARLAGELVERVWRAARESGETVFLSHVGRDILDDHMPFLMKGIPAIDIIDIDYTYWHTTDDTVDKCSPASLGAVGQVLFNVIYSE